MFYNVSMEKTREIRSNITPTFVVDFLETIMHTEVTNSVSRQGDTLTITLSDGTKAEVTAPMVARDTLPPEQVEAKVQNIATIRYITQHDYGYGEENRKELNRLELRNMDECRTYVEDAISSQLNAYFTNYLIEFFNGDKFMLAIAGKK